MRADRGVVLLDVLAAITIIGLAGISALLLCGSWSTAVADTIAREAELADAERLLAAHTLLNQTDLDLRLGIRQIGPYQVSVGRPEAGLYRIGVSRGGAALVDLVTIVRAMEPPVAHR